MAAKMKALVKADPSRDSGWRTLRFRRSALTMFSLKIHKTAICGTDIHIYNWDAWAQKTIPVPMVVGHEFVGRVAAVGSNVHDFKPGDLVSGEGHLVCGRCRNCLAGRRHLCMRTSGVGVNRPGAYAEYLSIPGDQRLVLRSEYSAGHSHLFRSLGQRHPHRPLFQCARAKMCSSPVPDRSAAWPLPLPGTPAPVTWWSPM